MPVVKKLAELNPRFSGVIETLGEQILQLPSVGLRDGLSGDSKTYDIAFVRSNPSLAFVTFKAPSHRGQWQPHEQYSDRLTVEVRFQSTLPANFNDWLHYRQFGGEGWYVVHVRSGGSGMRMAIESVTAAYHSFDP